MSDHLSPETVSDLTEGLLPPETAAVAESHLTTCATCSDLRAALAEVSVLLAGVPDPGPMPAAVADRIEHALAAQAHPSVEETAAAAQGVPAPAATVTPIGSAPSRRPLRSMRWLQAAAVAVLVAAGGALIVPGLLDDSSQDAGSTAAESAPTQRDQAVSGGTESGATKVTASGRDYTATELAAAARALVTAAPAGVAGADAGNPDAPTDAASPPTGETRSPQPSAPQAPSRLSATSALRACTDALAGGAVTPLAVDFGRWKGEPAVVVVLPGEQAGKVSVYVVRPDCTAADEAVLHFQSVPTP